MTLKRSRPVAALLAVLTAFMLLPPPAHAATTSPFDLLASAAQTASAQGGGIPVAGVTELLVLLSCTASSGTGETLDVYLQTSNDNGATWFDLPFELGQITDGDGTETTATTNKRDFFELTADVLCTTTGKAVAKYRNFGNQVRVAWFIAGTTPSYTFGVKAIGKN